MENIASIILKITSLPIVFYKNQSKSFYDLLKETKYFEYFDSIHEDNIANILLNNSNHIDEWFEWSQNKRSSDGWYLIKKDHEKYEVGRINQDGKKGQFLEFTNKRNACATFIKREIDELKGYR